MTDKPMKVSRARLARMTNRSPQAVSQWLADGLPHDGGGRGNRIVIDLDRALPWLVDNRGAPPGSERERLASEQANRLALANAQTRGELVRSEHVSNTIGEALGLLKEQVNGLPGRLATQLANIEDPALCRSVLVTESARILAAYKDALDKLASEEPCDQK